MMKSIKKIDGAGGFEVAGKHYTLMLKELDDESNAATMGPPDLQEGGRADKAKRLGIPVWTFGGGGA